jgi:two-component system chemotaxis sensor kinase CheA
MSASPEELLGDYASESSEHISELESLLLGAERESPSPEAISAILRCFHSLKGLSRVMGASALEKVAHSAETVMSSVSSGQLIFEGDLLEVLLRVLDTIRGLRAELLEGRTVNEAPGDILLALEAFGGASNDQSPATTRIRVADRGSELHPDHELLVCLSELLAEVLPELAPLIEPDTDGAALASAADSTEMLKIACQKLELTPLAEAFSALQALTSEGAVTAGRVLALARAVALTREFEQLMHVEAGANALGKAIADRVENYLRSDLQSLSHFCAEEPTSLAMAEQTVRRLLLLAQALGRNDAVMALLCDAVHCWRLVCNPQQTQAIRLVLEALQNDMSSLEPALAELRGLLTLNTGVELTKLFTERRLDAALLPAIPAEKRNRLASIQADSDVAFFEVILDVNAGTRSLHELATWLYSHTLLLQGKSITIEGQPKVSLLLSSTQDEAQLGEAIGNATDSGIPTIIRRMDGTIVSRTFGPPLQTVSADGIGDNAVRVPVEILDRLFGRVGEFFQVESRLNGLIFDENVRESLRRIQDVALRSDLVRPEDVARLLDQRGELQDVEVDVQRLLNLIHDATLGLRVIPFNSLFTRINRAVHDLAKNQGKHVHFTGRAEGIKIDKGMAELIVDPLMHMIHNAIDHGIELPEERQACGKEQTAILQISVGQTGNRIMIDVSDDGRGIDADKVLRKAVERGLVREAEGHRLSREQIYRFILMPGFSTAETVTETSGRGVGMDVALVNVTRLGGRIDIRSTSGRGTRFIIELPLSAAIQRVLLAETGHQLLSFPERAVVESLIVSPGDIQSVNGQQAILHLGTFLPVFRAEALLQLPSVPDNGGDLSIIVLEHDRQRIGVVVRRILRSHEVLMRETHPRIANLIGISGVATLGNGLVLLVTDPPGLFTLARRSPGATLFTRRAAN